MKRLLFIPLLFLFTIIYADKGLYHIPNTALISRLDEVKTAILIKNLYHKQPACMGNFWTGGTEMLVEADTNIETLDTVQKALSRGGAVRLATLGINEYGYTGDIELYQSYIIDFIDKYTVKDSTP